MEKPLAKNGREASFTRKGIKNLISLKKGDIKKFLRERQRRRESSL